MASAPFDRLVAQLDPAMVVVTVVAGGDLDGCLVGFHSQCSIDPARYALWLSTVNRTHRIALHADVVAVHALSSEQHALAALFGGTTGDDVDKLAGVPWTPGPRGVPLLDDVANRFVGRIVHRAGAGGDHELFVVEPVDAWSDTPFTPLRYQQATDIAPGHPA